MSKIAHASDCSGRKLTKGDTVTDLAGQITGRICDIANEDGTLFVRLRPLHQPYTNGVWHAADRVLWLADARKRHAANG